MTLSAVKLRRSPLSRLALTRLSVGAAACALLAALRQRADRNPDSHAGRNGRRCGPQRSQGGQQRSA